MTAATGAIGQREGALAMASASSGGTAGRSP